MYPHRELNRLGANKAALLAEIARLRAECVVAASGVARPLAWADRVIALARRLSPLAIFAVLPLGAAVKGALVSRPGFLGPLARWAPLVFAVARGWRAR